MKKPIMFTVVALFSLMLSTIVFKLSCSAEEKIIVAAADPYPPFVDPEDPNQGLSLAIVRAAYTTQGYTVKMEFVPWARAKALTIKGKYDILPDVWMTEENKNCMMFSEPYAVNTVKFIKRADDSFEFNGLASLKGKIIGTVRGYGYSDEFWASKDFIREDVADFITNIKRLTAEPSKRLIDLTLEDEIVAIHIIKKSDPSLLYKIRFTKNSISNNNLYISSGLTNPKHKEIIEAFNKGLAKIKANGEFNKIFESYGIKNN
ncbi:MAG: transporter substrate-binding domain-containing protein [Desulfamplus sp.]|nr:transporter substrate-binding domain-containing protein [Desulfamplus sp.]